MVVHAVIADPGPVHPAIELAVLRLAECSGLAALALQAGPALLAATESVRITLVGVVVACDVGTVVASEMGPADTLARALITVGTCTCCFSVNLQYVCQTVIKSELSLRFTVVAIRALALVVAVAPIDRLLHRIGGG